MLEFLKIASSNLLWTEETKEFQEPWMQPGCIFASPAYPVFHEPFEVRWVLRISKLAFHCSSYNHTAALSTAYISPGLRRFLLTMASVALPLPFFLDINLLKGFPRAVSNRLLAEDKSTCIFIRFRSYTKKCYARKTQSTPTTFLSLLV
jgi:hypothetical protein